MVTWMDVSGSPRPSTPHAITVLTPIVSGRDAYGMDVVTWDETHIADAVVWPEQSDETQGGTATTMRALLPAGAPVHAGSRLRLDDGTVWDVDGQPESRTSIVSARPFRTRLRLRRVEGVR